MWRRITGCALLLAFLASISMTPMKSQGAEALGRGMFQLLLLSAGVGLIITKRRQKPTAFTWALRTLAIVAVCVIAMVARSTITQYQQAFASAEKEYESRTRAKIETVAPQADQHERHGKEKGRVIPFAEPVAPKETPPEPFTISEEIWQFAENNDFLNKVRYRRRELGGRKFPQQLHIYNEPLESISNNLSDAYRKIADGVLVKTESLTPGYVTITLELAAGPKHITSIETWPAPDENIDKDAWLVSRIESTFAAISYFGWKQKEAEGIDSTR